MTAVVLTDQVADAAAGVMVCLAEQSAQVQTGNFLTGDSATFDGGTGTWTGAGNSTIASVSSPVRTGAGALEITSQAAGDMSAASFSAASILTEGLPCKPGDQIQASAWFEAVTTGRNVIAGATFYDSSGTILGGALYGSAVADTTGSFVQATATVTAPAGAAVCRLQVKVQATGAASEQHVIDDAFLANLTTGQSTGKVVLTEQHADSGGGSLAGLRLAGQSATASSLTYQPASMAAASGSRQWTPVFVHPSGGSGAWT